MALALIYQGERSPWRCVQMLDTCLETPVQIRDTDGLRRSQNPWVLGLALNLLVFRGDAGLGAGQGDRRARKSGGKHED